MSPNDTIVPDFDNETDESLRITLKKIDTIEHCCLIEFDGYIDTYNSSFFQNQITKVFAAGYINFIFNCERLSYISSTGLGSFTILLKMVRGKGGDLVLAAIQPKVNEVFQILGFSQFFTIVPAVEDAMAHFCNGVKPSMSVFPKVLACPSCGKSVKAVRAGRFRCMSCKAIIVISEDGNIMLG